MRLLGAFALALALVSGDLAADPSPDDAALQVPARVDIGALLKKPAKIAYGYQRLPGNQGVLVSCEVHSACAADADTLFAVLTDFARAKRLNPMLFDIRHDLSAWPPDFSMEQVAGFSILGIKVKYRVSIKSRYLQIGPGEYRGAWSLLESPDGAFSFIEGSFLVKELEHDGAPVAYMRWRQRMVIAKPFFGMRPFMDALVPAESMALLGRYAREAERREGASGSLSPP
jgi:hypothetical protein